MDPKEKLRRIAPELVQAIESGDMKSLAWGMVPRTNGRVFVRKFSVEFGGWGMVEVRLDRVPVWRSISASASSGDWELDPHWVPTARAVEQREAERMSNRSRQARRDSDRDTVLQAIREGRPVGYSDGQEWGTLFIEGAAVASARGVYRTLTGGCAGDEGWNDWLAEVTNPPAPVRPLPRRARRDAVQFALAAEGV